MNSTEDRILKDRILNLYGNTIHIEVGKARGEINFRGDYDKEYCVYCNTYFNISCIFNLARRRELCKTKNCLFSQTWEEIDKSKYIVHAEYKELGKPHSGVFEKIVFISLDYLLTGEIILTDLMQLNEYDDGFPQGLKQSPLVDWATPEYRKRVSSTRLTRDKRFRDAVLQRFGKKCVICKCDIPEILEAAHEHGYEVKDTDYDDPAHGICLCRIHHRLYDQQMIDIDTESFHIIKQKEILEESLWYQQYSQIANYSQLLDKET